MIQYALSMTLINTHRYAGVNFTFIELPRREWTFDCGLVGDRARVSRSWFFPLRALASDPREKSRRATERKRRFRSAEGQEHGEIV